MFTNLVRWFLKNLQLDRNWCKGGKTLRRDKQKAERGIGQKDWETWNWSFPSSQISWNLTMLPPNCSCTFHLREGYSLTGPCSSRASKCPRCERNLIWSQATFSFWALLLIQAAAKLPSAFVLPKDVHTHSHNQISMFSKTKLHKFFHSSALIFSSQ